MIVTERLTTVWCDKCKISYIRAQGYDFTVQEARDTGWIVGRKRVTCSDCQRPRYPGERKGRK